MKRLAVKLMAPVLMLVVAIVPAATSSDAADALAQATDEMMRPSPLDGRLGGTVKSFTAKYGQPIAATTAEPNKAAFPIKGHGRFMVTLEGNVVIGIEAIADRLGHLPFSAPDEKDWSLSTASRHAKAFLPADATYEPRSVSDGDRVVRGCHSAALAAALDPVLFARLGVGGAPGDCEYVLHRDKQGNIWSVTVSLGRSTGPATPQVSRATFGGPATGTKHCADFPTHADAQAYFEAHGGGSSREVRGLDADRDGQACESLP